MFEPRFDIPAKGDPFYTSVFEGGKNPAIPRPEGSKQIFQNCVFYAIGRYAELWGYWLKSCNAEDLADTAAEAGLRISQDPALGSLAVWRKGKTHNSSDGCGHVAVVEAIVNGDIVISQSGWSAAVPFWTSTRKRGTNWGQGSGYAFIGFVHPPDALKKGMSGVQVKDLQYMLYGAGYLRHSEIDGDFGKITLGAVLAYQFENGLTVDGVAGPATRGKLIRG